MRISTKAQNFDLYGSGAFGNCLRQWRSFDELTASRWALPVTMRYAGSAGGGWCRYDVPLAEVPALMSAWEREGADRSRIFFNETAPNHKARFQGEIVADERFGYALHYSTRPLPMRDALAVEARNHLGPGALLIVKQLMTPNSYADLRDVMDLYPDAAIELSIFSVLVGCSPRRNTIIWEVRNY